MVKRYIPDRGDLIWVDFNPQKGREQAGKRPALVISPELHNKPAGLIIACPITKQQKGYPFEVVLCNQSIDGLVLVNQVKTLDWEVRDIAFIEKVNEKVLEEVLGKLRVLI